MENFMSQCTNERTQTTINTALQLLSEFLSNSYLNSYLILFMHTICRLQREQPVCRLKAKTLISLRRNEATQTTIFSIDNKNALTLKTTYTACFS